MNDQYLAGGILTALLVLMAGYTLGKGVWRGHRLGLFFCTVGVSGISLVAWPLVWVVAVIVVIHSSVFDEGR